MFIIYLLIFFFVFFCGFLGIFFVRRNLLIVLMAIELMLLSINLQFLLYSCLNDDLVGQIFSFFVLIVAASESAIGLSLLLGFFCVIMVILVSRSIYVKLKKNKKEKQKESTICLEIG